MRLKKLTGRDWLLIKGKGRVVEPSESCEWMEFETVNGIGQTNILK
jgi:hypothetical protein